MNHAVINMNTTCLINTFLIRYVKILFEQTPNLFHQSSSQEIEVLFSTVIPESANRGSRQSTRQSGNIFGNGQQNLNTSASMRPSDLDNAQAQSNVEASNNLITDLISSMTGMRQATLVNRDNNLDQSSHQNENNANETPSSNSENHEFLGKKRNKENSPKDNDDS